MNEPFSVFSSSSCFRLSLCPLADRSPRLLRPREPRTKQLLRPAAQHPPPPRPIRIPVAPTAQHHNSQPPPHYHSPLQYAQLFMRANPSAASVRTIRYSSIECRLACRVGCSPKCMIPIPHLHGLPASALSLRLDERQRENISVAHAQDVLLVLRDGPDQRANALHVLHNAHTHTHT